VLVVGTSRPSAHSEPPRVRGNLYPSLAQIAGHALNSIFLDSLNVDIELVQRINRTISLIAPEKLREAGLPLRPIKVLVISPSQPSSAWRSATFTSCRGRCASSCEVSVQ